MTYSIYYLDSKIYGIGRLEDVKQIPKQFAYSEIQTAVALAESIFALGCRWVQIVDELGEIYAEYEY